MFNFGKKKEMSDSEKKAKLSALKGAHSMASDMMKGGLGDLKKVTVAADSKEGLKKGLDKAESIIEDADQEEESPEHELGEMGSEEESEHGGTEDDMLAACDTEEEIDDMIAKLEEKKKQLQS